MALSHHFALEEIRRERAKADPFGVFEEELSNPSEPFIRKTLEGLTAFAATLPAPPEGYEWVTSFQTANGPGNGSFDDDTILHARFKLIAVPVVPALKEA